MTIPLAGLRLGQAIRDVAPNDASDWRRAHRELLAGACRGAPHLDDALALLDDVYARPARTVAEISAASVEALAGYYGLGGAEKFVWSSSLGVGGSSSERVLAIVRRLGGTRYVTGHGARAYLDHELFERAGVRVEYMRYARTPYPQLHGEFTPYVTALDLVANRGRAGREAIVPRTVPWREFLS
jgi:hypothetical protein